MYSHVNLSNVQCGISFFKLQTRFLVGLARFRHPVFYSGSDGEDQLLNPSSETSQVLFVSWAVDSCLGDPVTGIFIGMAL